MLQRAWLQILLIPALAASFGSGISIQAKIAQDKDKFERETDALHKAKDFEKLGDEQVTAFARNADENQTGEGLEDLRDYRKEAHETYDSLKAMGATAERKPEGYRQLQIHLRRGIWEIDRALPAVPDELRTEVRTIRDDLADLEKRLIHELFPSAARFWKQPPKG